MIFPAGVNFLNWCPETGLVSIQSSIGTILPKKSEQELGILKETVPPPLNGRVERAAWHSFSETWLLGAFRSPRVTGLFARFAEAFLAPRRHARLGTERSADLRSEKSEERSKFDESASAQKDVWRGAGAGDRGRCAGEAGGLQGETHEESELWPICVLIN